ncbi:MAG: 50S ribosomal protein L6 [Phycisphaerae bacterium]|nr:50S ribosomal protein L6 [Phycisphaerae bacterium]
MSRIGKKLIPLSPGVKVEIKDKMVSVAGPKGSLSWSHPASVSVIHDGSANVLRVTRASDSATCRALHGMTRALINNMVVGVSTGYERKLEIYGTGYNCSVSGPTLELNCGYSHPVRLSIPQGVKVNIDVPATRGDETPARLTVTGIDKQVVGQFVRTIKDVRHPEPYKGKGIRYAGEKIRRKAGKAFAGAGG